MINNRYILGERLFGGSRIGELFCARDTLALQHESLPQVLIHFISSADMGYSEYRRISEQLRQVQPIGPPNESILKVLDCGWTGEKSYFVLESPETWSINALPPVSSSPTSLHRRADKLVRALQQQQLVGAGLDSSFFLVVSNGDLYVPGTALNEFVQQLQSDSDLLSGLISQKNDKNGTGVLRWLGWSLLVLGGISLASGAYINRDVISATFPGLFKEQRSTSQSLVVETKSVPKLSGEPAKHQTSEIPITLADRPVAPVISAKPESVAIKPEETVIKTESAETVAVLEKNTVIPAVAKVESAAKLGPIDSPGAPEKVVSVLVVSEPEELVSDSAISEPEVVMVDTVAEPIPEPDMQEAAVAATEFIPEVATEELAAQQPEAVAELVPEPEVQQAIVASESVAEPEGQSEETANKEVVQLAQVNFRTTLGPEADDVPVVTVKKVESVAAGSKTINSDGKGANEPTFPVGPAVSWNGMSEQKVLQRAAKALQNGRLQSALYYLRALWRKGVRDGDLLIMVGKVASDQQNLAEGFLAAGKLKDAKVAVKQASRLITEFNLSELIKVQDKLEDALDAK